MREEICDSKYEGGESGERYEGRERERYVRKGRDGDMGRKEIWMWGRRRRQSE